MSFENSWMSCRPVARTSCSSRQEISLLPQFAAPPGVTDFALENRPPSLPPRSSPARVVGVCLTTILCAVGSFAVLKSAAEPAMRHGRNLVGGVNDVVHAAIDHANTAADQRARDHYEAKQAYMARINNNRPSNRRMAEDAEAIVPALPRPRSGRSSLLLRMAALRKLESAVNELDNNAVQQYFPDWVVARPDPAADWNKDAVLRDLVLAVSQLAHRASIDGIPPPDTGGVT